MKNLVGTSHALGESPSSGWAKHSRDKGAAAHARSVRNRSSIMDEELDHEVVEAVRRFVDREVIPVASELEHNDEYPHELVAKMKELGLFGATIPQAYG